jgi:hypothetical protein
MLDLLPWALDTVTHCTPDAFGLFGADRWSGPRESSMLGNLSKRRRGEGYAAELICAAVMVSRSPGQSTPSIPSVRMSDGRVDLATMFTGAAAARSAAKADVLLTIPKLGRIGIDVKHLRSGVVASSPSQAMLDGVGAAIDGGAIASFQFVTPGRFTPKFRATVLARLGIGCVEQVWPTDDEQLRIRKHAYQRLFMTEGLAAVPVEDRYGRRDEIASSLFDEYSHTYWDVFGDHRDLRIIERGAQRYLVGTTVNDLDDATVPGPGLLAIAAMSTNDAAPRNKAHLRRFPLPPGPYDRGHLHAREAGGEEGIGANLIPQYSPLNRGRSTSGKRWRALERYGAKHPGTMVITRALYDDSSDVPAWLEVIQIRADNTVVFDRFANRLDGM